MSTFLLEIVTPEKKVFSEQVDIVTVKGVDGDFGIMRNHLPIVTALKIAPLKMRLGEKERLVAVSGGFIEMQKEKAVVLAESAELAEEIDVERAEAAKERSEQRLAEKKDEIDYKRAELALKRALTRIEVTKKNM